MFLSRSIEWQRLQRINPDQLPDVFLASVSRINGRMLKRWTEVHSTSRTWWIFKYERSAGSTTPNSLKYFQTDPAASRHAIFVDPLTHNRDRQRSATGQFNGVLKATQLNIYSSITIFVCSRMGNKKTNNDYSHNQNERWNNYLIDTVYGRTAGKWSVMHDWEIWSFSVLLPCGM